MVKYDEKYTWEKEKSDGFPKVNFLHIIIALLRVSIFLPFTIFVVGLFLFAKVLFTPIKFYYPNFLIRKLWSIFILRLIGLKLTVIGAKNLNSSIIVSNHISWIDILVIQSLVDVIFVAKADVKKMPGLGFLATIADTIFIDRKPQKISKDSQYIKKLIKRGKMICIFPEGTSTDGLRVIKFKSGFFQLLFDNDQDRKKQMKIVQPISIFYKAYSKSLSKDFYGWWGEMSIISHIFKILCLSAGSVVIKFNKPLNSVDFESRKEIATAAENLIAQDILYHIKKN